jgi:hypothetical protein
MLAQSYTGRKVIVILGDALAKARRNIVSSIILKAVMLIGVDRLGGWSRKLRRHGHYNF